MPRWIYNRPPEKCQETELRFAQKLNDLLPDSWIVRWGYWYEDNSGTLREGDFLVLGPTGGVAVFEVKTSLGYMASTGQWDTQDGDNPVVQLLAQHHGVIRRLEKVPGAGKPPWVEKALVLPSSDIAANLSDYRGVPRSLIVAANDLKDFDAVWRRLFPGLRTVTTEQTDVFLKAYGEGLEPKAVKAFVSETDKFILRQATANYKLLNMLSGNRQLVVEGGVGTGKSWYAIEQARRLAENAGGESGRKVLMVAYNLALCERLRSGVDKMRPKRGSITVRSSEALAAEILEASGIKHVVPADQKEAQRYFDEVLPGLAIEALSTEKDKLQNLLGKFDSLVVDEAQDHDTHLPGNSDDAGWWSIYAGLLRDGWQSPMALFGDGAQRPPFRTDDRFDLETVRRCLSQHAHLRLNRAFRYARPVYRFLTQLDGEGTHDLVAGLQTDGGLPDGPDVVLREGAALELPAIVEQILEEWEASGLCTPSKVLILYDRSSISKTSLSGVSDLAGHALLPFAETLDRPQEAAIGHSSIHKAKGLDALGVILVGLRPFEQLTTPYDRFTYFMGASRARQLLACVHVRAD